VLKHACECVCTTQTAEHWKWGLLSQPPSQATMERLTGPKVCVGESVGVGVGCVGSGVGMERLTGPKVCVGESVGVVVGCVGSGVGSGWGFLSAAVGMGQ